MPGDIGVSAITVAELAFGADKSDRPAQNHQAIEHFLLPLEVMAFDHDSALQYGQIKSILSKTGIGIGPLDTLIAAHAMRLGVPLVTGNVREFSRVPGLSVETWT